MVNAETNIIEENERKRKIRRLNRSIAIALAFTSILFGVATFVVMSGALPYEVTADQILLMIYIDGALLLATSVILTHRLVQIWSARRRGSAGAQIHSTLVLYFAALAAVPAILISIFSLIFFDLGLDSWFSQRVRTAVVESQAIAEAYLAEHNKILQADALRIARDISKDSHIMINNDALLERALKIHADLRNVTEALIFHPTDGVKARAGFTYVLEFEPIPQSAFEEASRGEVTLLSTAQEDRVRALVKLDGFIGDIYLLAGRYIDPLVLEKATKAQNAVAQFRNLEQQRGDIKISFAFAFMIVTLLLLLAAVWIGLSFAANLTRPISTLIAGTEAIRSGDLSIRVPEVKKENELATLSRAFNRMTEQLETQRKEIIEASQVIDERRRFTEAVLTGVSAGVIGLDRKGRIDLPNKVASELLGLRLDELKGHELASLVPEMAPLLKRAIQDYHIDQFLGEEIKIDVDGQMRNLYVRIGAETETLDDEVIVDGFIVTFDDITNLQSAQRKAAWADVAQRIAHEIKNPLTPIQLSAERLKRKYSKQIQDDKETFEACTDTIVRHVEDIGRMVSEFSSFARMPKPTMQMENLADLCRQTVFLQKNANRNVEYISEIPQGEISAFCDGRQISQVLTNLLQNAYDAIEGRTQDRRLEKGEIKLELLQKEGGLEVRITDNGKGLPVEERKNLMEPYVTTREKGTGLGLAIVKKIMEDHNGEFILNDREDGRAGAIATLIFSGQSGQRGA
ncbi:sensor histidine kinase NtrY-like [Curvivirga aplysinae]|uniref:sensor histidine kinase NtrY-like n=1 Tax=Curvivirga aplysinae TaxID=2529852 RepID=UPI0012BC2875|nr:PAS domain-containing sensor histidine kinase [Curvivirga aplysinae]